MLNTFSQVGEFNYADTIDYEEGFRMTGTVTVVDEGNKGSTSAANFDTCRRFNGSFRRFFRECSKTKN